MLALRRVSYLVLLAALLYASYLMLTLTLPYTALKPGIDFLKTKVNVYHLAHWRWSFYTHVFTAIAALVAGFTQFSPYIMRRMPRLHKAMGYVYAIDVLLVTGPAALLMSFYANGGLPARISFVLQALCWLLFTAIALRKALQKRFNVHGEWMLRSYALTLAAITLRTYAAILAYTHADIRPVAKYILIAWASWIPNLLIAELMIRTGFIKRLLSKRKSRTSLTVGQDSTPAVAR
jgi:hypothetical protein